jgi:hypothetical protein
MAGTKYPRAVAGTRLPAQKLLFALSFAAPFYGIE